MQLLKECIFVGLGGFTGAVLRYLITLIPLKWDFPLTTFIINITGAVLIGFIVGAAGIIPNVSKDLVLFTKVGVCGGYTTLSAFAVEVTNLFKDGKHIVSLIYVLLTIIFCLLGVVLGEFIAKLVFSSVK